MDMVSVNSAQHSRITSFIWGIADDVLRELYLRGKYRDLILPFTVMRRLDNLLELTKQAVSRMKSALDANGIDNRDAQRPDAAGQDFYNTSSFLALSDLRSITSQTGLRQQNVSRHRWHPD